MSKDYRVSLSDRIGVSRAEAAGLLGISPNTFDKLVNKGAMPSPKAIGERRVWHKAGVERAFVELPDVLQNSGPDDTSGGAPSKWANPRV